MDPLPSFELSRIGIIERTYTLNSPKKTNNIPIKRAHRYKSIDWRFPYTFTNSALNKCFFISIVKVCPFFQRSIKLVNVVVLSIYSTCSVHTLKVAFVYIIILTRLVTRSIPRFILHLFIFQLINLHAKRDKHDTMDFTVFGSVQKCFRYTEHEKDNRNDITSK